MRKYMPHKDREIMYDFCRPVGSCNNCIFFPPPLKHVQKITSLIMHIVTNV